MKGMLRLRIFLSAILILLSPGLAQSFNPGTHIYIAEQVFPNCIDKIDLYYGSIAPDLVLYANVSQQELESLFYYTHYQYINLRSSAWSPIQKAFAKGWLTHNELWAADRFAHIDFADYDDGYVYKKADGLQALIEPLIGPLPWDPWGREFAHDVIEVAIDLLLKQQDSKLGAKILEAALLRSWEDRNLLMRVLVLKARVTDWVTLASAEITFRNIVIQYAIALSLSSPEYMQPLAGLGKSLALEMYGITLTDDQALALLKKAIEQCQGDYMEPINDAIDALSP
jgi:hypothetical protein